jgi:hypothetical protein
MACAVFHLLAREYNSLELPCSLRLMLHFVK